MYNKPLVSIIAICYNHASYLEETLDSIIEQTYPNIQLIILDDCSSDNSVELINAWIKKNNVDCLFIPHQQNQGLCKTLNEGLNHVKGEFFQGIACDDIMMADKIEKNICIFLEHDESLAVVHSDAIVIDEKSFQVHDSYHKTFGYPDKEPEDYRLALLNCPLLLAPSVLLRTSAVMAVEKYDPKYFIEDWPMWLKLSKKFIFKQSEYKLIKYRILNNSMSRGNESKIKVARTAVAVLKNELGNSKKEDVIIKNTLKHYIEKLINFEAADSNLLRLKFMIDKTAYNLYLYLFSLIGINPERSNRIKNYFWKRKQDPKKN